MRVDPVVVGPGPGKLAIGAANRVMAIEDED